MKIGVIQDLTLRQLLLMEFDGMPKNRLEAFSDGIIAFVITLLTLEIHKL